MKTDGHKIIEVCGDCPHCVIYEDRYFCEPIKAKYGHEPVNKTQSPSINCPLGDAKTFDEWNKECRKIIKGEKALRSKDGKCFFAIGQTVKKKVHVILDEDDYGMNPDPNYNGNADWFGSGNDFMCY